MSFPYRHEPCRECPWRRDTPPGQFPAERYEALRGTAGTPAEQVALGGPIFACHKSPPGAEMTCAGWLATIGYWHLTIRIALARGELPAEALHPGKGWPELFASYDEMAEAQGARLAPGI